MNDYGFIHRYPETNFHELNLDWILAQMIELRSNMRNFVNQNTIKYADPIQWNITTQYEGNTVVIEPNSGNAYISSQPVPAGVAITNEDYWSIIGNFSVLYESIKESIAAADDGSNINATEARAEGSLLWLNSKLYKVLSDISVGALYITSGTGQNLQEVTIEELIYKNTEDIEAINDSITVINSSILSIAGKTEYIFTPEMFGAVGDGVTDDTTAINEALSQGGTIIFDPDATYLVDADVSLKPKSNSILDMNGATIKTKATSSNYYEVIYLENVDNVVVRDGIIIGDRDNHTGATGEWGMGIYIGGSRHILIDNMNISKCWGDGIYVGDTTDYGNIPCEDITITNCYIERCRRQGISAVYGENIVISGNYINDITGTNPQACIDIEPNAGQYIRSIILSNNTFKNSLKGVTIYGGVSSHNISNVMIHNNIFIGTGTSANGLIVNTNGVVVESNTITGTFGEAVAIGNEYNIFRNNKMHDIAARNILYISSASNTQIISNTFTYMSVTGSLIYLYGVMNSTFKDNAFYSVRTSSADDYLFYLTTPNDSGGCNSNVFQNNSCRRVTFKYAFRFNRYASYNKIIDNFIDGTYDYVAINSLATSSDNNFFNNILTDGTSGTRTGTGTGGTFLGKWINNIVNNVLVPN